jgi:hypothetical protein
MGLLAPRRKGGGSGEGAAEELRPDFEKRLGELGYDFLGIAHAFSLLSGPGTVSDAVEALERFGKVRSQGWGG